MKFLPVLVVTALEFGLLFVLFNWQCKLYHPTYVSFGVLMFVFWLSLNGMLYENYLRPKKTYRIDWGGEDVDVLIYREGKNQLELAVPHRPEEEKYDLVRFPSDQQWRQTMPDWAKEHKARITQNIKSDLGDDVFQYVDPDETETQNEQR